MRERTLLANSVFWHGNSLAVERLASNMRKSDAVSHKSLNELLPQKGGARSDMLLQRIESSKALNLNRASPKKPQQRCQKQRAKIVRLRRS